MIFQCTKNHCSYSLTKIFNTMDFVFVEDTLLRDGKDLGNVRGVYPTTRVSLTTDEFANFETLSRLFGPTQFVK